MGALEERWAAYEGGSGTDSLTFAYTVAAYPDSGGFVAPQVLANTLELNGGTIRSAATSTDADLSHDGLDRDLGPLRCIGGMRRPPRRCRRVRQAANRTGPARRSASG